MRIVCLLLATTLLASAGGAAERPNIIFIMADDLGVHDLGVYGQQLIKTPNIDRLATQGTRFTQAYAGASVCAPSRSVLMTGQHTGHTRVRGNHSRTGGVIGESGERGRVPLRDEDVTVAEVLKTAGYATGITGKWGLGEGHTAGTPNRQGFDQWFGFLNQDRAHDHYADAIWLNEELFDLPGNRNGGEQQYTHDLFTGFALNFIRAHQPEPFFLYVAYTVPHADHEAPTLAPYEHEHWKPEAKAYAAMITRMDDHVGALLNLLDELKLADNTIVFFASDNGGPAPFGDIFHTNGSLRAKKGQVYEGGLRVPLIARWPNHIPAGAVSDSPWYFADILPTFAELAGAKSPDAVDGVSVLPTLLGKHQDLSQRFLYWEQTTNGLVQASRKGDWKAVQPGRNAPLELYNLKSDPAERENIAALHPDVVETFEQYLRTARVESEDWPVEAATSSAAD